jgi:N-acetylglucosaminyldiphosphoundecaprenol N-acetyl-beta-D-mannosaminyltransferase
MVAAHHRLRVVAASAGAPDALTASRLAEAKPEIVLAAFGAGRQEQFLERQLGVIGAAVGIGVGGSLDFLAGKVRRAPASVRRLGLEWAWRLAIQPWRVRRQAVLPVFWWLERREARRTMSAPQR